MSINAEKVTYIPTELQKNRTVFGKTYITALADMQTDTLSILIQVRRELNQSTNIFYSGFLQHRLDNPITRISMQDLMKMLGYFNGQMVWI